MSQITQLLSERLDELLAIRPCPPPDDKERCMRLAREFLVREIRWARTIGIEERELSTCMDIGAFLSDLQLPDPIVRRFSDAHFSASSEESRACISYLRWCAIKEVSPDLLDLPIGDPYEPLIKLFREGGIISGEHGFFDVLYCGAIYVNGLRQSLASGV